MEIAGQDPARGVRDGIWRGRESGTRDAFWRGQAKIVLVELPDAVWSETAAPGSFHSRSLPFGKLRVVRGRSG